MNVRCRNVAVTDGQEPTPAALVIQDLAARNLGRSLSCQSSCKSILRSKDRQIRPPSNVSFDPCAKDVHT